MEEHSAEVVLAPEAEVVLEVEVSGEVVLAEGVLEAVGNVFISTILML